jgi:hypothetical protein
MTEFSESFLESCPNLAGLSGKSDQLVDGGTNGGFVGMIQVGDERGKPIGFHC